MPLGSFSGLDKAYVNARGLDVHVIYFPERNATFNLRTRLHIASQEFQC
jgi:hypothetical protein